mmetsp:Transcript_1255/g.2094  ORF Transcript_1255/g.2094 Transcript_1255/m.2094 type:complete len:232 (-) Transcript_1255:3295-3990(-)
MSSTALRSLLIDATSTLSCNDHRMFLGATALGCAGAISVGIDRWPESLPWAGAYPAHHTLVRLAKQRFGQAGEMVRPQQRSWLQSKIMKQPMAYLADRVTTSWHTIAIAVHALLDPAVSPLSLRRVSEFVSTSCRRVSMWALGRWRHRHGMKSFIWQGTQRLVRPPAARRSQTANHSRFASRNDRTGRPPLPKVGPMHHIGSGHLARWRRKSIQAMRNPAREKGQRDRPLE